MQPELSLEERQAKLEQSVQYHVGRGFRLEAQGTTSAQMVRPRQDMSCGGCLLTLLTLGLWPFIEAGVNPDKYRKINIYIHVNAFGEVSVTEN